MDEKLPKKACIICDAELDCAGINWDTYQPYGGGEIQLIFAYGSHKFDLDVQNTVFSGIICDTCAEKLVFKMDHRPWK